jgi:putative PIN family toxin of toxin-antitoxin system
VLRAVFDPGVLIAAALSPRGAPAELLRRWLVGDYEMVVSEKLLAELRRVLLRSKFRKYLSKAEAAEYVELFHRSATVALDPPIIHGITPDPGDDYLVSLARAAKVNFLVSGDPHLTELPDPLPPVLRPREFLERL